MDVDFDLAKDAENRRKHGLSLADAGLLDLDRAVIALDDRKDYGERRYRAYGFIDGRMYMLAFTVRQGRIRTISFRKCNSVEEKRHDGR